MGEKLKFDYDCQGLYSLYQQMPCLMPSKNPRSWTTKSSPKGPNPATGEVESLEVLFFSTRLLVFQSFRVAGDDGNAFGRGMRDRPMPHRFENRWCKPEWSRGCLLACGHRFKNRCRPRRTRCRLLAALACKGRSMPCGPKALSVLPAQGNALGSGETLIYLPAQRAKSSPAAAAG